MDGFRLELNEIKLGTWVSRVVGVAVDEEFLGDGLEGRGEPVVEAGTWRWRASSPSTTASE